jgi:hypothetical protein
MILYFSSGELIFICRYINNGMYKINNIYNNIYDFNIYMLFFIIFIGLYSYC